MAADPLRIGLVGCGSNGQIHADGLRKLSQDGEVVAMVAGDPSAEARAAAERNCRFVHSTADPMEVVHHPEVDAVMVCSPTATHRDVVVAAAAAGKPVFCEKPLAISMPVVDEMCDAVAAAGIVAQVGFHSRFHPLVNRLQRTVSTRELGDAMGYTIRDDQYWPTGAVVPGHSSWRSDRAQAGGGALIEHSIHSVDIACWLFGPVRRVHALSRSVFGYEVEDVVALSLEHESGTVGTLLTIFNGVRGREERRIEAFFEQGAVECTTDFVVGAPEDSYLVQRPDTPAERPDLAAEYESHFVRLGLERRDFIFYTYPADRAWVRDARAGRPASPGFEDARRAHQVVDAAYRSASSGEAMAL
jgi:predicted dehydrogenase